MIRQPAPGPLLIFVLICSLLSACQFLREGRPIGGWGDPTAMQHRLYDVSLPLLIAAADLCPFDLESTYGFLLHDAVGNRSGDHPNSPRPTVTYVHPRSAATSAGLAAGDRITQVNVQPVQDRSADHVMHLVRRLTAARIQPLQLEVERDGHARTIVMRAIPACQFSLQVIESDRVNGVSNGRQIAVTTAAMWAFPWNDELASIVAHEIAHNILRHAEDARLRVILNTFQQAVSGAMPTLPEPDSRSLEAQADYVGVYLMARAGYDLDGIRRVWKKFRTAEAHKGSVMAQMAQTHPRTDERYAAFEETLKEVEERQRRGEALNPRLGAAH